MKKLITILILLIIISVSSFGQSQKKYSAKEVKADLAYLRDAMEASNYNFYALTSEEIMDSVYTKIMNSINDSLSSLQTFRLLQPYVALAGMSHCHMNYPWLEYENYKKQDGTVFPLRLYFNKGKVLVRANFSQNTQIEKNDEILMVNRKPIHDLLDEVHRYISGPTIYFKNSQIEQREFARFFWFFFGEQELFTLKIRKKDGKELDLKVPSIIGKTFEEKMKIEESLLQTKRKFNLINDIAYIRPGHFLNDIPFDPSNPALFDNTEFCHFTDSAFNYFKEINVNSLIIDLRYNPGGDNSFSDYMISYFADRTFTFASNFSIKTSQITKDYWRELDVPEHQEVKDKILTLENGTYFDAPLIEINPHPDSIRFKGNVYVLINRYSYSNTSSVAAVIQDYKFGKIIGEETAEVVSSYGAVHTFNLPNTKWNVIYPKALGVRPNGDASQRGVIPDYIFYEDIFTNKDEVLEYTLKLIDSDN
jgi:C-terminal processing protease CtpA/Prc